MKNKLWQMGQKICQNSVTIGDAKDYVNELKFKGKVSINESKELKKFIEEYWEARDREITKFS